MHRANKLQRRYPGPRDDSDAGSIAATDKFRTCKKTPNAARLPQIFDGISKGADGIAKSIYWSPLLQGGGSSLGGGSRVDQQVHLETIERGGGSSRKSSGDGTRDEITWIRSEVSQSLGLAFSSCIAAGALLGASDRLRLGGADAGEFSNGREAGELFVCGLGAGLEDRRRRHVDVHVVGDGWVF